MHRDAQEEVVGQYAPVVDMSDVFLRIETDHLRPGPVLDAMLLEDGCQRRRRFLRDRNGCGHRTDEMNGRRFTQLAPSEVVVDE